MSDFEDFIEFSEYVRRHKYVGPRRYLRDFEDPFSKYSNTQFLLRYRLTPQTVKDKVLPMLEPHLRRDSKRGLPFSPEIMVLLTLRFFATGSVQEVCKDIVGICQQSISRIVANVASLLATKMTLFVKFPNNREEITTLRRNFYEIAEFPGVLGCIDCTHIRIKNPGGAMAEVYRNSKGWFSINVQAVTGPKLEFLDLVVRWPGSTHESFIFNKSTVKQRLGTGELQGFLLGDSEYAESNVLLTPFSSPNTQSQERYNRSHIKTRNSIERAFGVWKRRFPCLQLSMSLKLTTVVAVICACATLHNIAILENDLVVDGTSNVVSDQDDVNPANENSNDNGFMFRESLVERFFS